MLICLYRLYLGVLPVYCKIKLFYNFCNTKEGNTMAVSINYVYFEKFISPFCLYFIEFKFIFKLTINKKIKILFMTSSKIFQIKRII